MVNNITATWYDAEKNCREQGGHIATPTSEQENSELWNRIKR